MSNKKPIVLLLKELLKPIENALVDINEINTDLLKINEKYLINSLYVYVFSIFEVSLKNSLEYLLLSIPDKIKSKSFDIEKSVILENGLTQDLIENEVEKYINGLTYKSFKEFFDIYCNCMDICKPDENFIDDLIERKATRNLLLHKVRGKF